jgi:hypothetical protein
MLVGAALAHVAALPLLLRRRPCFAAPDRGRGINDRILFNESGLSR